MLSVLSSAPADSLTFGSEICALGGRGSEKTEGEKTWDKMEESNPRVIPSFLGSLYRNTALLFPKDPEDTQCNTPEGEHSIHNPFQAPDRFGRKEGTFLKKCLFKILEMLFLEHIYRHHSYAWCLQRPERAELDLQSVVSCPMWVLGRDPRSWVRAANALKCWFICPTFRKMLRRGVDTEARRDYGKLTDKHSALWW